MFNYFYRGRNRQRLLDDMDTSRSGPDIPRRCIYWFSNCCNLHEVSMYMFCFVIFSKCKIYTQICRVYIIGNGCRKRIYEFIYFWYFFKRRRARKRDFSSTKHCRKLSRRHRGPGSCKLILTESDLTFGPFVSDNPKKVLNEIK